MSMLTNIRVGDKIATVRYGANGGARPVIKVWTVIAITKTTVRATLEGKARSWSIASGSPMSYGEPEATPYTPAVQQQHDDRLASWEAHEERMRERLALLQAHGDALKELNRVVRGAATIERIAAIVAAAKKAAEGGAPVSAAIETARASVPEMREALLAVDALKQAGMRFVPIPVLNDEDRASMLVIMGQRLAAIEAEASKSDTKEGGAA